MAVPEQLRPENTRDYTIEDHEHAVHAYLLTGNSKKAHKMLAKHGVDIPASTIRYWRREAAWWDELYETAKRKHTAKMDARFTGMLDKISAEIEDRILRGDVTVKSRRVTTGRFDEKGKPIFEYKDKKVRVKAPLRDLVKGAETLHGMRALDRGDPTSRTETKKSTSEKLKEVEKKTAEWGRNKLQAVKPDASA